ncbi:SufD family Fe-S cluster assembly protein [Patescibacteria group bacterium]|nr:SufD family Fe-S cluster assembly protein [Patescibacteria group bacterium]
MRIRDVTHTETILELPQGAEEQYAYRIGKNTECTILVAINSVENRAVHLSVRLCGSGSRATIIGLVLGRGTADIRLHTLQQHEAPDTVSNLLVKTVLSENAQFFYDGGIRVEPSAPKTDAYQRNENLLLSRTAHAESKPSLEILADDVRCTHGATIGSVSEEELWYLESRGIERKKGETLILSGFLKSAITGVDDRVVKYRTAKVLGLDV